MAKNAKYKITAAAAFAGTLFCSLCFAQDKIAVSIKSGESASAAALQLKEKKLIFSKNFFIVLAKITGAATKLKAGYYEFSPKDGSFKIVKILKDGSQSLIKFTVPEGSNIKQTAEIISQKLPIDKNVFIETAKRLELEGYLMPETYFVNPTLNEEQIINVMRKEFDKKVTPQMREKAMEMGVSMKDVVTLASIVEKEAVKPQERAVIAAVFYNRLKKKIRLESCATVLYAMGINKAKLTLEDTEFDSPYNTYRHSGLPPGAICSPGIQSIKAVLYPANTSSLFFVSQGNGSHFFAENLNEHIKNKREAKKIQKRQTGNANGK